MDIFGNDGVPAWLKTLGVKKGEWFIDSKARAQRAMKSACFSGPARIHIYLGLATMGFQQELAVKMEAGKRVPVAPVDVCAATSMGREHFREHMNCLEVYGLAKCEGWTKGRVRIYSWAIPRAVDPKRIIPRAGTIFPGLSPDLHSLLNHYRVRFPPEFVPELGDIEELDRLARGAKQAETSLRTYAKGLCARTRPNKEERNERNIERNSSSSPPPKAAAMEEEDGRSSQSKPLELKPTPYEEFKALYPATRFDGSKTKPLFEKKTPKQQAFAIERLKVYLQGERWQKTPQFIPWASNWILSAYEEDPPALLQVHNGRRNPASAMSDLEKQWQQDISDGKLTLEELNERLKAEANGAAK